MSHTWYHWTDVFRLMAGDDIICRFLWVGLHFPAQPWSAPHSLTYVILVFFSDSIFLWSVYTLSRGVKYSPCPLLVPANNVSNVFVVTISMASLCLYSFVMPHHWGIKKKTVKCVACVNFTNMSSNSLGFCEHKWIAHSLEFFFFFFVRVFLLFWNTLIRFVITGYSQTYSNFSAWKGFAALPVLLKQYDTCNDRPEVMQMIH